MIALAASCSCNYVITNPIDTLMNRIVLLMSSRNISQTQEPKEISTERFLVSSLYPKADTHEILIALDLTFEEDS